MDPLSTTASIIAVIQLSSDIVSYISRAADATRERMRLRNEVLGCESILQQLKDEANNTEEGSKWTETIKTLEASDGPLGRLWAALSAVKIKLEPNNGLRKALLTLKWPFDQKEVEKIIVTIEHEKSLLGLALANNSRKLMLELKKCSNEGARQLEELIQALEKSSNENLRQFMNFEDILTSIQESHADLRRGVDGLKKDRDDRERRAILEWLTPIDNAPQQSDFIYRRKVGTGQWLLNSAEFQSWLNTGKQTLFCRGIPGAGKTIITSIVVDHLSTKFDNDGSIGIAFLYCDYQQQHEQKTEHLLRNLLRQLIQGQSSIPDSVQALYNRHKDNRKQPSLNEISRILHSVTAIYSRVFVVVDALDECQDSDGCRKTFIEEMLSLQAKIGVNLFATSRPIPEIIQKFAGGISLEIRASNEDVRLYLDGRLSQLPAFVRRYPKLQDEIKTEIVKTVDGMFLLAQLHFDSLIAKRSPRAVKTALKNLPNGYEAYDHAYNAAIERIEGQVADSRELAEQVLSWITCAKRPLTTAELRHALAVEVDQSEADEENVPEIEDIIAVCAGLVTVDEESDIVRLVHYTAKQYFERTQRFRFPDAEAEIARTCLTYLSFDAFESGFCPTDEEFEARLRSNVLYDYAARNWGHHVRVASMGVGQIILNFLENEAKISSSSQALMAFGSSSGYYGYSQSVPRQMTGTHLAAYFGLREEMIALVRNGHDPDYRDTYGRTPLSLAAENGHEIVAKLLLAEYVADPGSKDTDGWTSLSHAVANGHETVVELLLVEDTVDPDCKDSNNRTPLLYAAWYGYETLVKLLLATVGVDPNSKDSGGWTALSYAAWYGHEAVVKLLLAKSDVYPDSKDSGGCTPLSLAAEKGHEAVVKLLLAVYGVDRDSKDNNDRTPLSWATENGHEMVVKLLLTEYDVDPDSKDSNGWTPLQWAAENRHEALVKLLLVKLGSSNYHNGMAKSARQTTLSHPEALVSTRNPYTTRNNPSLVTQTTLGILQYIDASPGGATSIDIEIEAIIDKGFFLADNEWTCYRRNYFSCICSYSLTPYYPDMSMHFVQTGTVHTYQVYGFAMCISAVVADNDGQSIDLVQHAPKRDKRPEKVRFDKVRLSPKKLQPGLHEGLHPGGDSELADPSRTVYDQNYGQVHSLYPVKHTFERIQFKQATANNGKRRAAQQYYHLVVELWADVGSQAADRYIKIAYRKSVKLIVRGRSPGHYQLERSGSTGSGPCYFNGSIGVKQPGDHLSEAASLPKS
ncbi:uncharacterized protein EAE97_011954 [Botrytis byssoidea]|uniref:NDT80 domain-containing protein n=1 Tax=Botrytis byssoidea TaxID=139641 RepID=A0A9P5HN19_9HELO|nr:uncharacterized protein EAE97_011954 [Botrytis byssoidea]KAF7917816.1 hypothetical protein EAE97_011954 [Botrytis byssoidea]